MLNNPGFLFATINNIALEGEMRQKVKGGEDNSIQCWQVSHFYHLKIDIVKCDFLLDLSRYASLYL